MYNDSEGRSMLSSKSPLVQSAHMFRTPENAFV